MNSSDLASLCLRSSLTTPRHLAGEDKAPAPRGRDGTSAQALLASTGNIWPTRNTQREANYAQPACSLRRDSVHPSPLPTGPADTKHQNGRSRGRTPTPEAPGWLPDQARDVTKPGASLAAAVAAGRRPL